MAALHLATSTLPTRHSLPPPLRASPLSWSASIAVSRIPPPPHLALPPRPTPSAPSNRQCLVVCAAWTRRSRGEAEARPNRKSWKQRTDMYMRPFLLNVFFSKRFVHAKVMHRGTSKVIAVATTNAKDLRLTLPSLVDDNACRTIGRLIAERSMDADVFAMAYEPKKNERIEGKAIWKAQMEGKHRFFAWLLVQSKLLTADKLMARNWPCNPACSLCQGAPETAEHLCLHCPFALQVWQLVHNWTNSIIPMPVMGVGLEEWWRQSLRTSTKSRQRMVAAVLVYTAWNLWNERNRRIFQGVQTTPHRVFGLIKDEINLRQQACGAPVCSCR